MSIISTAEATAYLGISDTTGVADFIDTAQEAMENACGRSLVTTSVTEYHSGSGQRSLWLRDVPESITSIHVDANRAWGAATALSATDYMLIGCQLERLDSVWTYGQRNIRVIYAAGYTTVPDRIKHLAKIQVAAMYAEWIRAKRNRNNLASENVGGWATTWLERRGVEPEVAEGLKPYRPGRL